KAAAHGEEAVDRESTKADARQRPVPGHAAADSEAGKRGHGATSATQSSAPAPVDAVPPAATQSSAASATPVSAKPTGAAATAAITVAADKPSVTLPSKGSDQSGPEKEASKAAAPRQ